MPTFNRLYFSGQYITPPLQPTVVFQDAKIRDIYNAFLFLQYSQKLFITQILLSMLLHVVHILNLFLGFFFFKSIYILSFHLFINAPLNLNQTTICLV